MSRTHAQVIDAQQRLLIDAVRPLIGTHRRVALLDFPQHNNVGDNAIWLGEVELLRRLMLEVVYSCELASYDADVLRATLGPGGLILLHGGGNFGDVWPEHQRFRERVLADFPDHPIVQLPQSVHFGDAAALAASAEAMRGHPDFTVLVRDRESLELVTSTMGLRGVLAPDAAFMIGPVARPCAPVRDVVWIARHDHESAGRPDTGGLDAEVVDWLVGETGRPLSFVAARATVRARTLSQAVFRRSAVARRVLPPRLYPTLNALAQRRFERGLRIVSRGRVLVTDRLHGHIVGTLLGLPQVLLDNHYGKIRRYHAAFTHGIPEVQPVADAAAAVERARELLAAR